ncbi:MAG: heme exporter protein CcmD [Rhodospirillales bacterium]
MAFVEMGGYGVYVWPAFGVTALVLAVLAVTSLRRLRSREQTLAGMQRTAQAPRAVRNRKSVS